MKLAVHGCKRQPALWINNHGVVRLQPRQTKDDGAALGLDGEEPKGFVVSSRCGECDLLSQELYPAWPQRSSNKSRDYHSSIASEQRDKVPCCSRVNHGLCFHYTAVKTQSHWQCKGERGFTHKRTAEVGLGSCHGCGSPDCSKDRSPLGSISPSGRCGRLGLLGDVVCSELWRELPLVTRGGRQSSDSWLCRRF